jgi:hypothetical protein
MKEMFFLVILSGFLFFLFLGLLIAGLALKKKMLAWSSAGVFLFCILSTVYTINRAISKAVNKVQSVAAPRPAPEIYEAILGTPVAACVQILESKDQLVPRLDPGIFLHFKSCPAEVKRLLARHNYQFRKISPGDPLANLRSSPGAPEWFRPFSLNDTIYEYSFDELENQSWQTLYVSRDSTQIYLQDLAD